MHSQNKAGLCFTAHTEPELLAGELGYISQALGFILKKAYLKGPF